MLPGHRPYHQLRLRRLKKYRPNQDAGWGLGEGGQLPRPVRAEEPHQHRDVRALFFALVWLLRQRQALARRAEKFLLRLPGGFVDFWLCAPEETRQPKEKLARR